MESVIKQAEESRNRARETAKLIHINDYQPLKHDIDRMRRDYLGLERLPELCETETDLISSEYVLNILKYHTQAYNFTCSFRNNELKITFYFIAISIVQYKNPNGALIIVTRKLCHR